ncbi:DUF4236 domain-containing protein [Caballeronia sp. ATUFL_F1_KS39]|uniref:DUF4236 domain-containing protein n=1 Tax=Caballeronia sp. ATUFL_F1_KS39 TaxID=2921766 RepID=UPI0025424676|nr:DUF4236 domain-containing protein [Caballeronia sp. ATUFL_F1_KS39]
MGGSWRKSVKVLPGVRSNMSKNGSSFSLGGKGVTYNTKSGRTTYSVPGTGWRYTTSSSKARSAATEHEAPHAGWIILLGILLAVLMFPVMVVGALLTSGGQRRRIR